MPRGTDGIFIAPITGFECLLELKKARNIAIGAKITLAAAKKFRVEGDLLVHQYMK